jgi:hypothetical protein
VPTGRACSAGRTRPFACKTQPSFPALEFEAVYHASGWASIVVNVMVAEYCIVQRSRQCRGGPAFRTYRMVTGERLTRLVPEHRMAYEDAYNFGPKDYQAVRIRAFTRSRSASGIGPSRSTNCRKVLAPRTSR